MSSAEDPESSIPEHGRATFATTVLQRVTWRAVLITQSLGLLFALMSWLERWHQPGTPRLLESVLRDGITALLVMLAAFVADEAVRRGSGVWRVFVLTLLVTSVVNVLGGLLITYALSISISKRGLLSVLYDFFGVGGVWGTVLMVYLNRQRARRLLARLRAGELERAEAERRLMASRLAAAESQVDPSAVLRQLAEVRNLYAAGRPEAEEQFEALIVGLRKTVAHIAAAQAQDQAS